MCVFCGLVYAQQAPGAVEVYRKSFDLRSLKHGHQGQHGANWSLLFIALRQHDCIGLITECSRSPECVRIAQFHKLHALCEEVGHPTVSLSVSNNVAFLRMLVICFVILD